MVPIAHGEGNYYHFGGDIKKLEDKVIWAQRELARKKEGSENWNKALMKLLRAYRKLARARKDYLHKVTYEVSKNFVIAFVEHLRILNMTRSARGTIENPGRNVAAKRGLNRVILRQGWGELRRQLTYKMQWRGGQLIAIDPRYTSQMCSRCGCKSSENRTSQACFQCIACGFAANADKNAAINILNRGIQTMAAGQAVTVCGEFAKANSMKQKPAENRKRIPPSF